MKTLTVRTAALAALGAAALCWKTQALAQNVVVQAPPQQAAPPAAAVVAQPVVVAQPAPATVVGPGPVVVNGADTGERTDTRPNRALLMTGFILGGVPYVGSIAVAATSHHVGDSDLWIPILGPYLDVGNRGGCPVNNASCGAEIGNKALLIGDGVLQTVGAFEILGAFIFPETFRSVTTVTTASGGSVTFAPSRVGTRDGYGIAALGEF
jgi:hypothetical protein